MSSGCIPMPSAVCKKCGATTNSAVSNYWMPVDEDNNPKDIGVVTMCYAAFDDNHQWVKGCSYDKSHSRQAIDSLIDKGVPGLW